MCIPLSGRSRARFGSPPRGELPTLENGRFIRRKRRARRTGAFHRWGQRGESLDQRTRIKVFFICVAENVVERIPWAKLGRKDVATALLPDPLRGRPMAWIS